MQKIISRGKRGSETRRLNIDAQTKMPLKAGREVKENILILKWSVKFGYSCSRESWEKELGNKERRVGCAENDLQVMEDTTWLGRR